MTSATTSDSVRSVASDADPDREAFRPAIHYTAERNWLNDPNGLVRHKGLYHLFYQYNPDGNVWGNMSWGHASSQDLCIWTEHPLAIAGDIHEDIFSGSIVADMDNTSGFGSALTPPLVAIYTSAFTELSVFAGLQAQSLAYSLDDGFTWTKYEANPVLSRESAEFRDPKVFRFNGTSESYWVMIAVEAQDRMVVLYKSANLRDWTYLSSFGPENASDGEWECPDLFPLPLDGDMDQLKWVLIVSLNPGGVAGGSGGQYFVGTFDGVTFRSESTIPKNGQALSLSEFAWLDWGRDYYAAVSFSDVPGAKRIMIAWMNNWDYANDIPTSPWKSAMSLPRQVRLATVEGKPRLVQEAVDSADRPVSARYESDRMTIDRGTELLPVEAWGQVLRIDAELRPGTADEVGLVVRGGQDEGTFIGYNAISHSLVVNRMKSGYLDFHRSFASVETAPVDLIDGVLRLRIYVDRSSVEVFAQGGIVTITDQIFPKPSSCEVALYAHNGKGTVESLVICNLGVPTQPIELDS